MTTNQSNYILIGNGEAITVIRTFKSSISGFNAEIKYSDGTTGVVNAEDLLDQYNGTLTENLLSPGSYINSIDL